ncbi:uncharacterized protein K452DRAFT_306027 [Aplosporella prunicola CBS 121167]|uniref:Uncharacterized protein n=1 Tax=Aplosporella prunicola CBS 121167 TaxID=1176127 RepID=A0A6A6BR87_9PEZI|nr:uncharacterized protein K452DRAFT_306027 [Aplosporella prunicola CBS 121167]KAF2145091.1 hypothetical protein K452DRAFT_306027 [Aplosporella prunicola CBS 121167]
MSDHRDSVNEEHAAALSDLRQRLAAAAPAPSSSISRDEYIHPRPSTPEGTFIAVSGMPEPQEAQDGVLWMMAGHYIYNDQAQAIEPATYTPDADMNFIPVRSNPAYVLPMHHNLHDHADPAAFANQLAQVRRLELGKDAQMGTSVWKEGAQKVKRLDNNETVPLSNRAQTVGDFPAIATGSGASVPDWASMVAEMADTTLANRVQGRIAQSRDIEDVPHPIREDDSGTSSPSPRSGIPQTTHLAAVSGYYTDLESEPSILDSEVVSPTGSRRGSNTGISGKQQKHFQKSSKRHFKRNRARTNTSHASWDASSAGGSAAPNSVVSTGSVSVYGTAREEPASTTPSNASACLTPVARSRASSVLGSGSSAAAGVDTMPAIPETPTKTPAAAVRARGQHKHSWSASSLESIKSIWEGPSPPQRKRG